MGYPNLNFLCTYFRILLVYYSACAPIGNNMVPTRKYVYGRLELEPRLTIFT